MSLSLVLPPEARRPVELLRGDLLAARVCDASGSITGLPLPYESELETLLRFCRSNDYDRNLSIENLRDHLTWREEICLDELVRRPAGAVLGVAIEMVAPYLRQYLQGSDRDGRPCLHLCMRDFDATRLLRITSMERLVSFHIWGRENLIRLGATHGKSPYLTVVLHLEGVRLKQATRSFYRLLRQMVAVDEQHYPELSHRVLALRSPYVFTVVWKVIQGWLDEKTLRKISIVGSSNDEVHRVALESINDSELPRELGGCGPALPTRDCFDGVVARSCFFDLGPPVSAPQLHAASKLTEESEKSEKTMNAASSHPASQQLPVAALSSHSLKEDAQIARVSTSRSSSSVGDERYPPHVAELLVATVPADPTASARLVATLLDAIDAGRDEAENARHDAQKSRQRLELRLETLARCSSGATHQNGVLSSLQDELKKAREECDALVKAVAFARNYIETIARLERDGREAALMTEFAALERRNKRLRRAVVNSIGMDTMLHIVNRRPRDGTDLSTSKN